MVAYDALDHTGALVNLPNNGKVLGRCWQGDCEFSATANIFTAWPTMMLFPFSHLDEGRLEAGQLILIEDRKDLFSRRRSRPHQGYPSACIFYGLGNKLINARGGGGTDRWGEIS